MASLSRRSFVELSTGLLTSLPVLAGGFVLAPRPAQAEPDATDASEIAGKESAYVVIDVVSPWEVGFMVVDVSKGTTNDAGMVVYPPVKGAHVEVISRFNKQVATGVTNDDGVANIDIRKLAVREEGEDENNLDDYHFNGTVSVTCDGYRNFKTALLFVEGGTGLQVPAHSADEMGIPYPHLVSFDEWDALYSRNDFVVTAANSDNHTIGVEIWDLPRSGEATVSLWVKGERSARASMVATLGERVKAGTKRIRYEVFDPDYGERIRFREEDVYATPATASFTAPFLKADDKAVLPIGAHCEIRVAQDGTTWSWPLAFTTSTGVVDEPSGKENTKLSPINTSGSSGSGLDMKWPGDIPLVGGGALKFWAPELPVNLYVNPFGLAQFTIKSPSWGYLNDGGASDKNGWGKYPRKSVEQQWEKKKKVMKSMSDKTSALVSKPGAAQHIDLFKSFSVMVNFQLLALAKWDNKKSLFEGEVAGQITAALNFTITENFFAGPIPVLITFALDASLVFGLSAAAYSTRKDKDERFLDAIFDFSRWRWDYANTGFTMTFSITPSLSVGVGIRGIASISVKGAITLTLYLGVPMGTQPEGVPSPHLAAGWSAQVSLVLELFLFTQSFALYNKKFEYFADNWEGKDPGVSGQAEDAAMGALANMSIAELLDGLVPITDAMLAQTREASFSTQALSAQAEKVRSEVDWDAVAREEIVELEDGSIMTFTVYEPYGPLAEVNDDAGRQALGDGADSEAAEGAAPDVVTTNGSDDVIPTTSTEVGEQADAASTDEQAKRAGADDSAKQAGQAKQAGIDDLAEQAASTSVAEEIVTTDGAERAVPTGEAGQTAEGSQSTQQVSDADATPAGSEREAVSSVSQDDANASTLGGDAGATDPEASTTQGPVDKQIAEDGTPQESAEDGTPKESAEDGTPKESAEDGTPQESAADSSALEAQAEIDDTSTVTWLSSMAEESLPSLGVAALGAQGGVRPSSDKRLFGSDDHHVLNASHAKVIDIGAPIGKTKEHGVWCFRIASVEVDGQQRTRLVANCIEGDPVGTMRLIEFGFTVDGIGHADLYDYDFDVVAKHELYGHNQSERDTRPTTHIDRSVIHIVILSGRRGNGGSTPLASASTDLCLTYLWLFSTDFVGSSEVLKPYDSGREPRGSTGQAPHGSSHGFSIRASKIANEGMDKLHCISNLQITGRPKGTWNFELVAVTFLDRFADTPEEVLGEQAHVRVGAFEVLRTPYGGQPRYEDNYVIWQYAADWWHKHVGDIDSTVYELEVYPGAYPWDSWYLMLRGAKQAHYVKIAAYENPRGYYMFGTPSRCEDYDCSIRLVPCAALGGFLTSYPTDPVELTLPADQRTYAKWTLHKATWSSDATPKLQMESIGPAGFNVVNFAVNPSGTFIFWPHTRDDNSYPVRSADGNEAMTPQDACYQIMACRVRGGRFSDPFVVADLPTDTDSLSVVSTNGSAVVEMLRNVYVDTGDRNDQGLPVYHAADIWYTSVPAVRCVTATACEAVEPFVSPGGKISFHVAVRNDGNTFLSGCSLTLCALDESTGMFERVEGATTQVTFDNGTICASIYNQDDGSGGLTNLEPDYALAPGKTSVYRATVTVPSTWPSGEKKVLFVASDGVLATGLVAQGDELQAMADELDAGAVEFHIEPGEYRVVQVQTQADQDLEQRHMETIAVDAFGASGEFAPAPVTIAGGDETTDGGVIPAGGGGLSTKGGGLPNTGDGHLGSGFGVAGVGFAALGAAMATYERRRVENERRDE